MIEALILEARGLDAAGERVAAVSALTRALALGQPEGYVRSFVDEGAAVAQLLISAYHHPPAIAHRAYIASLLAACGVEHANTASSAAPAAPTLVEQLSEREVLRLMADGLSNQQIAERLVVGVSTIKKHINNIFSKLDVQRRTQALARARATSVVSACCSDATGVVPVALAYVLASCTPTTLLVPLAVLHNWMDSLLLGTPAALAVLTATACVGLCMGAGTM